MPFWPLIRLYAASKPSLRSFFRGWSSTRTAATFSVDLASARNCKMETDLKFENTSWLSWGFFNSGYMTSCFNGAGIVLEANEIFTVLAITGTVSITWIFYEETGLLLSTNYAKNIVRTSFEVGAGASVRQAPPLPSPQSSRHLGPAIQMPINANPRSKIHQGVYFSTPKCCSTLIFGKTLHWNKSILKRKKR